MIPLGPNSRWRARLAGVACVMLAAPADNAAFAQEPPPEAAGIVSAVVERGRIVWSDGVEACSGGRCQIKRYVLMTRYRGVTRRVPVRSRRVPFDADLGLTAAGGLAAIYSRCRRERVEAVGPDGAPDPGFGEACRLHVYDFRRRREVAVTPARWGTVFAPALWRDRIVFARTASDPLRGGLRRIETMRLGAPRSHRRIAGYAQRGGSGPLALDLRGTRLAFVSSTIPKRCGGIPRDQVRSLFGFEIYLGSLRSFRAQALESLCRPQAHYFTAPRFSPSGQTLQYYMTATTPGRQDAPPHQVRRADVTTRRITAGAAPAFATSVDFLGSGELLAAIAKDGRTRFSSFSEPAFGPAERVEEPVR